MEAAGPRNALFAAVALGLTLSGCADDASPVGTTTDGVESDSAGEATYGVPMSESDSFDPDVGAGTSTGGAETESASSESTDTDTEGDTDTGGGGSESSTTDAQLD